MIRARSPRFGIWMLRNQLRPDLLLLESPDLDLRAVSSVEGLPNSAGVTVPQFRVQVVWFVKEGAQEKKLRPLDHHMAIVRETFDLDFADETRAFLAGEERIRTLQLPVNVEDRP